MEAGERSATGGDNLGHTRAKDSATIQACNPVSYADPLNGILVPIDLKVTEHETRSQVTRLRGLTNQVQPGTGTTCYSSLD